MDAPAPMRRGEKDGARSEIVYPMNRKKFAGETCLVDSYSHPKSAPAVRNSLYRWVDLILAILWIFTRIQVGLSGLQQPDEAGSGGDLVREAIENGKKIV